MSVGNFPESLSQAILVGIMLVGRLVVQQFMFQYISFDYISYIMLCVFKQWLYLLLFWSINIRHTCIERVPQLESTLHVHEIHSER